MIEPISNIIGGGEQYLQRIYLATKLQEHLKKIHPDPVKVVIRGDVITLKCKSPAQATFFRLRRRHLQGAVSEVLRASHKYKVRIAVYS